MAFVHRIVSTKGYGTDVSVYYPTLCLILIWWVLLVSSPKTISLSLSIYLIWVECITQEVLCILLRLCGSAFMLPAQLIAEWLSLSSHAIPTSILCVCMCVCMGVFGCVCHRYSSVTSVTNVMVAIKITRLFSVLIQSTDRKNIRKPHNDLIIAKHPNSCHSKLD